MDLVSNSLQLAEVVLTLLFQLSPQRLDCCAVVVSGPLHGFFLCLSAGAIRYGLTDAACVMRLKPREGYFLARVDPSDGFAAA